MKRPSGKLRIIGGEFRRRLVDFDPGAGVRPTPDRVRQTLFDWLAPVIEGARCLDLFAGSGALGLEALSRGAAHVTFVETGRVQAEKIREALARLGAGGRADVRNEDAMAFLASPLTPALSPATRGRGGTDEAAARGRGGTEFDIAFLDPPFDSELLAPALARLPRWLAPSARVYAEWHRGGELPWPAEYTVLREKKAGQVSYALATCTPGQPGGPDA